MGKREESRRSEVIISCRYAFNEVVVLPSVLKEQWKMASLQKSKKSAFHFPLKHDDSSEKTVGCRHTNPAICAKNSLSNVCAFVRHDGMCMAPPVSWKKQFLKLKGEFP